jgi:hypothetical protein
MKNFTVYKKYYFALGFFILGLLTMFLIDKPGKGELYVTVVHETEKTDLYTIDVEYPQFPNLPKQFNKKIKQTILDQVSDFKKTSEENVKARRATASPKDSADYGLNFLAGWTAEQLNNSVVSIVIHTSYYTGGAHGGRNIYTFNFDGDKKREITLDSLFRTPGYLDKIAQYTMNDLKDQLKETSGSEPNMSMLREGTSPKIENFSKFTIGVEKSITFYFEQYQVAPYVAGEQKVVMPLSYIISN